MQFNLDTGFHMTKQKKFFCLFVIDDHFLSLKPNESLMYITFVALRDSTGLLMLFLKSNSVLFELVFIILFVSTICVLI